MTITAMDSEIRVILNHQLTLDIDLEKWTEPHKNPDGTKNKFDVAYKDLPRKGWIGFQDNGQNVWFRNIRIKKL